MSSTWRASRTIRASTLIPSLSRTINYECFEPLVLASKAAGVKRFVYVSSSSVYGVSDSPEVTEEHPLVPLTDYNKYKGLCEPILFRHQSPDFTCVTIRPATVCGYSPRMRFDLTVNILTNHAYNKGVITVFGGDQQRPNIHIDDVCELYVELLAMPAEKIAGEIFNAGYQNQTVNELAEIAKQIVEARISGEDSRFEIEHARRSDDLALLPHHLAQNRRETGLGAEADDRGRGARPLPGVQDGKIFGRHIDDDAFINVKTVKALSLK